MLIDPLNVSGPVNPLGKSKLVCHVKYKLLFSVSPVWSSGSKAEAFWEVLRPNTSLGDKGDAFSHAFSEGAKGETPEVAKDVRRAIAPALDPAGDSMPHGERSPSSVDFG